MDQRVEEAMDEQRSTRCAMCHKDPADGSAWIGDERYCHGPVARVTCYERAQSGEFSDAPFPVAVPVREEEQQRCPGCASSDPAFRGTDPRRMPWRVCGESFHWLPVPAAPPVDVVAPEPAHEFVDPLPTWCRICGARNEAMWPGVDDERLRMAESEAAAFLALVAPEPADVVAVPRAETGVDLIAAERARQVEVEGWTPEHDAEHKYGVLIDAAICYADRANGERMAQEEWTFWPWAAEWWKPSPDPVRNLVKAGALIAAEIDRLRAVSEPGATKR